MTETPSFPTFSEFFTAIHGGAPYPWQQSLAARVEAGAWPRIVEIPTGLGKTTTIAAAVYELARQCHLLRTGELECRTAPQRIFHVVNRRTLVEDTGNYLDRLASAINQPSPEQKSVLVPVRTVLKELTGTSGQEAVTVDHLHGGRTSRGEWLRATGCVIVTLTPHQFVSRLLMRGFGVGSGSRPIEAGLVGVDRIVLFDEPHLATPAIHAILDAQRIQATAAEELGVPLGELVVLGATPSTQLQAALDVTDRESVLALDPVAPAESEPNSELIRRVSARRQLSVHPIRQASESAFAKELASLAIKAAAETERVVVFTNTVGLAQAVFVLLQEQQFSSQLVTSRFRPFDRPSTGKQQPTVTVATQCLEVGVDLSFDVLITELCSWNALVQRLGRLNRDGRSTTAEEVNAHLVTQEAGKLRGGSAAVYEAQALTGLHDLLKLASERSEGVVDVSLAGLHNLRERADMLALEEQDPRAGTLHHKLVPVMIQTRPAPYPDLPIGAFIAGPDQPPNLDLQVAWRSWLEPLSKDSGRVHDLEQVSLPVAAVRKFLTDPQKTTQVADHGRSEEEGNNPGRYFDFDQVLIFDQQNERWAHPTGVEDLYTTDQIVLSTDMGGYSTELGWTGLSGAAVPDVSLIAALQQLEQSQFDSSFHFTLTDESLAELQRHYAAEHLPEKETAVQEIAQRLNQLTGLDHLSDKELEILDQRLVAAVTELIPDELHDLVSFDLVRRVEGHAVVQLRTHRPREKISAIYLDDHQRAVAAEVHATAQAAGIEINLVPHLVMAARFHDEGKQDERFQQLLDRRRPNHTAPALAKSVSGIPPGSPRDRALRRRLGIPAGWRHEAESLRRVDQRERDVLMRHLIGSHHGWYRPGFRLVAAEQTEGVTHATDFQRLNQAFGPWGLAYLEALVRLADREISRLDISCQEEPLSLDSALPEIPALTQTAATHNPQSREEYALTGLRSQPAMGWYTAVGLLGAAADLGDQDATVRWEAPGAGAAPVIPVIRSTISITELVAYLCTPEHWVMAEEITAQSTGQDKGLSRKNQKLIPAGTLRELLLAASRHQDDSVGAAAAGLILGLVGDLSSAGKDGHAGQVELPIAAWANNSSYPGVAIKRVIEEQCAELAEAALFSENAGYSGEACDGGLDRHAGLVPLSNGMGAPGGERYNRPYLAPLIVSGMAYLGHAGARPLGFDHTGRRGREKSADAQAVPTLRLPLTTADTTLLGTQALTMSIWQKEKQGETADGEWFFEFRRNYRDKSEIFWEGGPHRRPRPLI